MIHSTPQIRLWFLLTMIVCCLGPAGRFTAGADPLHLLESESPYVIGDKRFEIRTEIGYETGLISDLYLTPSIGFGIMEWLDTRISVTGVHFFEDNTRTPCSYSVTVKTRVIQRDDFPFNLFPYLDLHHVLTQPVEFDVVTKDGLSTRIVSPHTDKGMDLSAGFGGYLRFVTGPLTILIPFGAEYSRTFLRDYYTPFAEGAAKNRISWHVSPGIAAFDDVFGLTVQNRFVHWFDRGFSYEITPTITLSTPSGLSVSMGVGIPAYSGGIVKVIMDIGFATPSLMAYGSSSDGEEEGFGW
jgi:hypothetical protein